MTTEQDTELLSQYIDGELDKQRTQALRRRLLAEPELRGTYDALCEANEQLTTHYQALDAGTVPGRIHKLLGGAPNSNGESRNGRGMGRWGLAVAASIVAASGLLLVPQGAQFAGHDSNSAAALASALEASASRGSGWDTLADGREFRAVLSFQGSDGDWCREYFVTDNSVSTHAVACRVEGQWQTQVQVPALLPDEGGADTYRPAGASSTELISDFIESHASGIALNGTEESTLIRSNWQ